MSVTIEKIQRLVEGQLGIKGIQPGDRLLEELGAQSADVVNLISALEDQYDIDIEEDEIAELKTVNDLFTTVQKHL